MNWAWAIPLPPTPKLVLMALADIADDQGICWPSHKTLSNKCTLSDRTLRRVLARLQSQHFMEVTPRVRKDGSHASNSYRLAIDLDPPGQFDQGGGHTRPMSRSSMTGEEDMGALPRTTNEPSDESLPPPMALDQQRAPRVIDARSGDDLCFPKGLSPRQQQALRDRLASLATEHAQQVLDELAGRMAVATVKNPIRYCSVLASRLKRAAFFPELGLKVADARERERERAQRSQPPPPPRSENANSNLPSPIRNAIERMRALGRDRGN